MNGWLHPVDGMHGSRTSPALWLAALQSAWQSRITSRRLAMDTRSALLTVLLFAALPAVHAELPPAYLEAIQRQRRDRFNENEVTAFVYRFYALYDKHVPVERYLPLLASKGLELRFPEETLRSRADFRSWYAGIGKNIASNTHTLDSVKVQVHGGGRYQADIVGLWRAETRKGEYIQFKFHQRWIMVDATGKGLQIQTYLVEEAK